MLLEISQNLQEKICARASLLIKLQAWPATLLKKTLVQVFPVNFVKFLRTPFFTEHLRATASANCNRSLNMQINARQQASKGLLWKHLMRTIIIYLLRVTQLLYTSLRYGWIKETNGMTVTSTPFLNCLLFT